MHEKVEHLFAEKTQRQNKLPFSLLSLFRQILLNINLRDIYNNFNSYI